MTAVFGYCPDKVRFLRMKDHRYLKECYRCVYFQVEVKLVFRSADRISYEEFEHWVYKKCFSNDSRVNAEMLFTLLDKDCT